MFLVQGNSLTRIPNYDSRIVINGWELEMAFNRWNSWKRDGIEKANSQTKDFTFLNT